MKKLTKLLSLSRHYDPTKPLFMGVVGGSDYIVATIWQH